MTLHVVKIPVARVGVLIGPKGKAKAELEARSGVTVEVDSDTGDVTLDDEKAFEPVLALKARDVVRAVGRGFPTDEAFRLFQEDAYLDVLDLTEFVGKEKKQQERVRSRIIGSGGKTRASIEAATGVTLRVYGKTVSIIGDPNEVDVAREAVVMLLNGAAHATVYRFLERKRKELRLQDIGL